MLAAYAGFCLSDGYMELEKKYRVIDTGVSYLFSGRHRKSKDRDIFLSRLGYLGTLKINTN